MDRMDGMGRGLIVLSSVVVNWLGRYDMKFEEVFDGKGFCTKCGHPSAEHGRPINGSDGIERLFCRLCPGKRTRMIGDEGTDYPIPYFIEASRMLISACWEGRRRRAVENFLPHSPGPQSASSVVFKGVAWTTEQFENLKPGDEVDIKGFKYHLYYEQEGLCVGCHRRQSLDIIEVDHIVPRSLGGGDTVGNLQLLCPTCNGIKGNRTMDYLRTELQRRRTLMD